MAKVQIICIYLIKNPNGRIYIGQTWDLNKRYKSGVSPSQRLLYRSYQKHGKENHTKQIIHQFIGNITQPDLDYWETHYIELYRIEGYQLLNIREGGGNNGRLAKESKEMIGQKSKQYHKQNPEWSKGNIQRLVENNRGSKRLPESKKAISDGLKAHTRTEAHCKNISLAKEGKPSAFKGKSFSDESKIKLSNSLKGKGVVAICQYRLDGTLIKEWPSVKDAAESLNLPTGTIGGCIRKVKHYKTCGGFIWRYKSDNSPIIPDDHKQAYNPKECPVVQFDTHGDIINEFNSVKEATNLTGINRACIIMTCRGSRNSAGGFTWKYKSHLSRSII